MPRRGDRDELGRAFEQAEEQGLEGLEEGHGSPLALCRWGRVAQGPVRRRLSSRPRARAPARRGRVEKVTAR
ncbi:hypothetical protein GCM10011322_25190 [Salinarimonas ramus]|uniref:Uncharacterized protein n=1 Tax=Salinarimonas ramus TaxID=690164 RepID=A0A917V4R2_9HYPH|nr:hypothetical protein GCM10011322_25190 [Salinarimonas ramus]